MCTGSKHSSECKRSHSSSAVMWSMWSISSRCPNNSLLPPLLIFSLTFVFFSWTNKTTTTLQLDQLHVCGQRWLKIYKTTRHKKKYLFAFLEITQFFNSSSLLFLSIIIGFRNRPPPEIGRSNRRCSFRIQRRRRIKRHWTLKLSQVCILCGSKQLVLQSFYSDWPNIITSDEKLPKDHQ